MLSSTARPSARIRTGLTGAPGCTVAAVLIGGHVSTAGGGVEGPHGGGGGAREGARARRRVRLRVAADLQPVAAHVAADAVEAGRHRRVPLPHGGRPDPVR